MHGLDESRERLTITAVFEFDIEVGGGVLTVGCFEILCKLVELSIPKGTISLN
jgi:hypothetical protein